MKKGIEKHVLFEVKKDVNNLRELVNYASETYGNAPAFRYKSEGVIKAKSYNEFAEDVNSLGTTFHSMFGKGKKIALISENSYEWILAYFATANSENIIVPLDKELSEKDIEKLIISSDAEILLFSENYHNIKRYIEEKKLIKKSICLSDFQHLIEDGEKMINNGERYIFEQLPDDNLMCTICYTSGTTGDMKGVMLSHQGITISAMYSCEYVALNGNVMLVLPMHHTYCITSTVVSKMIVGSEICINSGLKNFMNELQEYQPTEMDMVPLLVESMYNKIWDSVNKSGKGVILKALICISNILRKLGVDKRRKLFSKVIQPLGGRLDTLIVGGAALDPKYVEGFESIGIKVVNGYGITECSPIVAANGTEVSKKGSVGMILGCCEVRFTNKDEEGKGEIWVRGKNVMLGYYNDIESTNSVMDGEWFDTGDLGYIDNDGFLYITGRKKNLIILGNGKNVCPEELEQNILNNLKYVKEVVVYGKDDKIVAEAYIEKKDVETDPNRFENDIIKLNKSLPNYKNIGKCVCRFEEFEKTSTKKIKR